MFNAPKTELMFCLFADVQKQLKNFVQFFGLKMPNVTSFILTVVSYFVAFFLITERVQRLAEVREEQDRALQEYSTRWPLVNVQKMFEFKNVFLEKGGR